MIQVNIVAQVAETVNPYDFKWLFVISSVAGNRKKKWLAGGEAV